jgi:Icc-related predicted phosphoesterase
MKAQLISDLHTETQPRPLEFLGGLEFAPDLDFLLLPGDIVVMGVQEPDLCREVFGFLGTKARYVLYAIGNHEYYGRGVYYLDDKGQVEERIIANPGTVTEQLIASVLPSNFVWLNNSDATLDGVHFYGGAMWFPDHPFNKLHEHELNDFLLIPDIHDWVYQSNTGFREHGLDLIRPETIVLSHHLPSHRSTSKIYKESMINRFFVSDEERLIEATKPRLWVHGHTHFSCNYMLGDYTHVVCNPHGYPKERKEMKKKYTPVVFEV